MIKAVIFDCFGVLTADRWKEFVATLSEAQREEARSLNHAYDAGHMNKAEFLDAVHELTGERLEYIDDRLDNETVKNTQLLHYIAELKKHYKTAILSNIATNWINDYFLNPDERQLFDAVVLSFEVGTTKPDPRMYQAAAERLDVEPPECVFIDDTERYCVAAEDLGMKSVWYRDFGQMRPELEKLLADVSS